MHTIFLVQTCMEKKEVDLSLAYAMNFYNKLEVSTKGVNCTVDMPKKIISLAY